MKISLFDAHCDTITTAMERNKSMCVNDLHVSFQCGKRFFRYAQFFAVWTDDKETARSGFERFIRAYEYFLCQIDQNSRLIRFCKTKSDYDSALKEHKIAAFLSMENALPFGNSEKNADTLLNLGIKMVTLTWNGDNQLAGGCMGEGGGLTYFGKKILQKLIDSRVLVDVSHLSDRGFYDIAQTDAMIVASHSNLQSVYHHKRNLTDGQFLEIVRRGGGAGINLYPLFLGGGNISDIIRHIEGFLSLGGENHIFLGADFDGIDKTPKEITCLPQMAILYNELLKRNYSQTLTDKIFYGNLERIMLCALV